MLPDDKAKKCPHCHQEFDEETNVPRILVCFHTVCSGCVERQIDSKSKECPICAKKFRAKRVDDVTVNKTVLDLMKYVSHRDAIGEKSRDGNQDLDGDHPSTPSDRRSEVRCTNRQLIFECQRAKKTLGTMIKTNRSLSVKAKDQNVKIQKEIVAKLGVITTRNKYNCLGLWNRKRRWPDLMRELNEKQKQLKAAEAELSSALKPKQINALTIKTEKLNSDIDRWVRDIQGGITEDDEAIQMEQEVSDCTGWTVDLVSEVLMKQDRPFTSKRDILPEGFTPEMKRILNARVWRMALQGNVYAVQQKDGGGRRSAKITIAKNKKLCLHHLTDAPVPPKAHVLEFSDVMKLVNPSSRLVFFDLVADGKKDLGRIYIRLIPNTQWAQLFTYLCTGEKGLSYAHQKLFATVATIGGSRGVLCGFPRCVHTTALMVTDDAGGEHKSPLTAGSVRGKPGTCSEFDIYYEKGSQTELVSSIFGRVEEGLHYLPSAVSLFSTVEQISFDDVGIVLSESMCP